MDIIGAIKAALTVASQWMSRKWGTQTSEQATLQSNIEHARAEKRRAYRVLVDAKTPDEIKLALDDVNRWDAELTRLSNEAAAKWP